MAFPRGAAALLLAVLLPAAARADENKEITFHAGLLSLNSGKSIPGGAASGAALGFRFLHDEGDCVSLGMDVDLLKPKDKGVDNLTPGVVGTRRMSSSAVLMVVRVGVLEGQVRPYGLLGFGLHFTNIHIDASPKAGTTWADTGTTEKRVLMDANGRAQAIKFQAGADYAVTENFLAGGFLALNSMGSTGYGVTDAGSRAGLLGSSGALTGITFGLNLTGRF